MVAVRRVQIDVRFWFSVYVVKLRKVSYEGQVPERS